MKKQFVNNYLLIKLIFNHITINVKIFKKNQYTFLYKYD